LDTRSGEHLLVGVFVSVEALKEKVNEAGTEVPLFLMPRRILQKKRFFCPIMFLFLFSFYRKQRSRKKPNS
jgi:hypothetical protein